jgi:hypothetical protein
MGRGSCEDSDVIIPKELGGYRVTRIGYGAFRGSDTLKSVTIPDSVTAIGEKAFSGCTALTSVSIPSGVEKISNYAFRYCTALTSIVLPETVKSVGEKAFADCTALTRVSLPTDVSGYSHNMLDGCNLLSVTPELPSVGLSCLSDVGRKNCVIVGRGSCKDAHIVIPREIDGYRVVRIGAGAFADCRDLTKLTIPDSVERMDKQAFRGSAQLKEIRFQGKTERWLRMAPAASWTNPVSYTVSCSDGTVSPYGYVSPH